MRTRMQETLTPEIIAPDLLLNAYRCGIFPMAENKEGEIHWYETKRRAIFPLEGLRVARSLRQTLNRKVYSIRLNTAFETVIRHCADREETWISESIIRSYCELHKMGFAYSVESWQGDALVGGLYGVALGGAFFGESMFSTMRDASKVALVGLVRQLLERRYVLLDAQFMTPHLGSLGAVEVQQAEYLKQLRVALRLSRSFMDNPILSY